MSQLGLGLQPSGDLAASYLNFYVATIDNLAYFKSYLATFRAYWRAYLESLLSSSFIFHFFCLSVCFDFEGAKYVGKITELLKDEDDGTPFLQVRYEDGDTEEFVEEDIELLDEFIEEHQLRKKPSEFIFDRQDG